MQSRWKLPAQVNDTPLFITCAGRQADMLYRKYMYTGYDTECLYENYKIKWIRKNVIEIICL